MVETIHLFNTDANHGCRPGITWPAVSRAPNWKICLSALRAVCSPIKQPHSGMKDEEPARKSCDLSRMRILGWFFRGDGISRFGHKIKIGEIVTLLVMQREKLAAGLRKV